MAINCCRYCVSPKRYPGCHGQCSEYISEKATHDALKAVDDKRKSIEYGLNSQYADGVHKAYRTYRKKG